MRSEFLETGQIVNTHGIRGEVKIVPWSDTPAFLLDFSTLYVDNRPMRVVTARVHKNAVLVQFEGVEGIDAAIALKGKTVSIARRDAQLPPGAYFLADLIGLRVEDEAGEPVGTLREVLSPSAQNIYRVEGPGGEHLIPAVPAFVKKVDIDGGVMTVSLIEGM